MSVPVLSWSFYAGSNHGRTPVARRTLSQIPQSQRCACAALAKLPCGCSVCLRTGTAAAARGHSPPDPQSQSFSRSYGSILPTSLIYILLWTRGYTPWRPDAVMSTPGGANTTWCSNFQGPSAAHRTRGNPACFTSVSAPSPGKPIPGPSTSLRRC